jgi:hypothetical protein
MTVRFPPNTTEEHKIELLQKYSNEATTFMVKTAVSLGLGRPQGPPRAGQETKRAIIAMQFKMGEDGKYIVTKQYAERPGDNGPKTRDVSEKIYRDKPEGTANTSIKLAWLKELNDTFPASNFNRAPSGGAQPPKPANATQTTPGIDRPIKPFGDTVNLPNKPGPIPDPQAMPVFTNPRTDNFATRFQPQVLPKSPNPSQGPDSMTIDVRENVAPVPAAIGNTVSQNQPPDLVADRFKMPFDSKYSSLDEQTCKNLFLNNIRSACKNLNRSKIQPGGVPEFNYMALRVLENSASPYQVVLNFSGNKPGEHYVYHANLNPPKTKVVYGAISADGDPASIQQSAAQAAQKFKAANQNANPPLTKLLIPFVAPGPVPHGMLAIIELDKNPNKPPKITIIDPIGHEASGYMQQQIAIATGLNQVFPGSKIVYNRKPQQKDGISCMYHQLMNLEELQNEDDIQGLVERGGLQDHNPQAWVDNKIKPHVKKDLVKLNPIGA